MYLDCKSGFRLSESRLSAGLNYNSGTIKKIRSSQKKFESSLCGTQIIGIQNKKEKSTLFYASWKLKSTYHRDKVYARLQKSQSNSGTQDNNPSSKPITMIMNVIFFIQSKNTSSPNV